MKIGASVVGVLGFLVVPVVAGAQNAPPARTGFQMAVRTGYSIPTGSVVKDVKTKDFFSGQVPVILDIGGKVIPELFIGGYLGLGFGSEGNAYTAECSQPGVSCSAVSVHVGAQIQYNILPGELVNPWLGYGIGVESNARSTSVGGNDATATLTGFQFARLMTGVDFRVSRVFGVGPFIDYSLGQYSQAKSGSTTADIPETATHGWLTLGVRGVFFP